MERPLIRSVRKHVRLFFFILITAFVSTASIARSIDVCPVLPESASVEWVYHKGPDFDVCYAVDKVTEKTAFGIYMGGHPDFEPDENRKIEKGILASKEITWYRKETEIKFAIPARETTFMINEKDAWFAHIWIISDTEEELKNSISTLEKIIFK